ncbi:hypothetical protein [Hymenobacter weizhouensis]|uniref:hypothetical protein n=1 Tax=Hymenobacter sp. YIM 151500-1 TaxID=2987689 RepID=UPI002227F140|nr:hypothetical protein [Hymenobacter sp. YIM 151500-1]UYZ61746.1 hypothetical protein OIS53_12115 [Hymenobacter sp. YIM 151500-1]
MTKLLLLLGACGLLAGSASAQDTPPARPTDGQGNWLTFDKPVPPAKPDQPDKPEKPGRPAATPAEPLPQPAPPRKTTMGTTFVPLDVDVYRLIDRYAILHGPDSLGDPHTSVRPYTRAAVARLAERMLQDSAAGLSRQDRFNIRYLLRDNWHNTRQDSAINQRERPLLRYFYQRPSDLYSVEQPDFSLRVNPVAGLSLGNSDGAKSYTFLNTRGVQVEGTIDERLGFYTFLADNQMAVPLYVQQRVERDSAVAHEGFWKPFKTTPGQYDFLSARGYLTYAAGRHVSLQLGHDRNHIGNGYRSLILSDYAAPYLFLKVQTRIWKFHYQNLFAQLIANNPALDDDYERKYLAFHHLSLDVLPNLNVGLFESVLYSGYTQTEDIVGTPPNTTRVPRLRRRGFELQYLNPIIFYRAIEQSTGSEDNALLGADFKWNLFKRVQLYGQLVLDEFVLSEIRSGNGWWANKQAVQLGVRYINVAGIRNFDVQGEFNFIRPFTYQHEDRFRSYQHAAQPLAHPMGANLWELMGIASYQPLPRLHVVAKGFLVKQGLDPAGLDPARTNYGSNVLRSYNTRPQEYGYQVGSGLTSTLFHGDLTATWQAAHNLWLDGKLIYRRRTFENSTPAPYFTADGGALASVALRWNIAQRLHEF